MKTLKPIKVEFPDYDDIEDEIVKIWRREIYVPLLKELGTKPKMIKNDMDWLLDAIRSGQVYYDRGYFDGIISATVSRELKKVGAQWDKKRRQWRLTLAEMPRDVMAAVRTSEEQYVSTVRAIDKKITQILPEEVASYMKIEQHLDSTLFKVEREFEDNVKNITVAPKVTKAELRIISAGYTKNLKTYITEWTQKQTLKLRGEVQKAFFAGQRQDKLVKLIQTSYGESLKKARFLARQETSLMMAAYSEARYSEAGIKKYEWRCVAGSKNHPVRPWHKKLEGKIFTWDNPPITTEPGTAERRNNPGQDYNCRCYALPVVKF